MRKAAIALLCLVVLCTALMAKKKRETASPTVQGVNSDRIKNDIKYLASDALEGRGTGAHGGDLAADYIAGEFAKAGLVPAGDNGTYMQKVPMVGMTTEPGTTLSLETPKQKLDLKLLDDAVVLDESQQAVSDVESNLLFIGYGITAPEYNWDDYAGQNVKGKVLLMLVNEPPSDDPKFFAGKSMTYYGRWTYKFEHAGEMGAAGVILIHRTDMASYGWGVVRSSWSGERSTLADDKAQKVHLAGWMHLDVARKVLADAGQDVDKLIDAAGQRGFKPMPLPIKATAHVVTKVRHFDSKNVVGMVKGSDPVLKDQAVVFTAHYDHLGMHPDAPGDNIYNGAVDNASGTAIVIEMARAAASAAVKPKRSFIFSAVTAEEQGLWGSAWLGQHPPIPAERISLNLNFDSYYPLGIPKSVSAAGYSRTDFGPAFEKIAADYKLKILPPSFPDMGGYFRSDHFSFAKVGVPAFSVNAGSDFDGHTKEWVDEQRQRLGKTYHQPSDEFWPEGDYRCDAVMARFGLALGYRAADQSKLVQWKAGDEFEAARKTQGMH